jgi:hexokinase
LQSTAELSEVAELKNDAGDLARDIIERSASLVAAQIAAIYDFKKSIFCNILLEGSLFWKGYGYKKHVLQYLENLEVNINRLKFSQIENSSIIGASQLL